MLRIFTLAIFWLMGGPLFGKENERRFCALWSEQPPQFAGNAPAELVEANGPVRHVTGPSITVYLAPEEKRTAFLQRMTLDSARRPRIHASSR